MNWAYSKGEEMKKKIMQLVKYYIKLVSLTQS